MTKEEFLKKIVGDPVFLMCVRFSYRGKVVSVSADGVVLKDAFVVLNTGSLSNKKASNEEALPGLNFIALDAVEGVFPYLPFIMQ